MRLALVLALLLTATAAAAQLVTPSSAYTLAWDYVGPAFDHFEVRYASSGPWTNVGKAQQAPAPVIPIGSHTAQVRVCRAQQATAGSCVVTALPFTVSAAVIPPPAAAPTNVILALGITPMESQ